MEPLFQLSRWAHIAAGFIALFVFWIPLVVKKGGPAHRVSGWIYVWAMVVVSISSFYMGIYRIGFDPQKSGESIAFAWFLIFIAILSGATAWYGIRVLKYKSRVVSHRHPLDLLFPSLLLLAGIGISIYGFIIDFPLLAYFPLLGLFLGGTHLLYWLRKPKLNQHWLMEHITGMMSCCIATITAFTVFGAPRLLHIESTGILLWILPSIIIVPLLIGFTNYYRKKCNPTPEK
ncbi:DUF2306 domain-containing protein [Ammoniphilus oxalaticus]|uniref:DUF2306 domain-containing protein n=1 Tax=Ammoniphilus oxalaticus TaxID=66863 RepID=A0A419SKW2_9BACL|nr:DUF2306 domain-containing protein [Ammoniphilus oxalaticus]RKD24622.1 DUF2306 domain-containing protein [Ammoniphilus oxalaticus]